MVSECFVLCTVLSSREGQSAPCPGPSSPVEEWELRFSLRESHGYSSLRRTAVSGRIDVFGAPLFGGLLACQQRFGVKFLPVPVPELLRPWGGAFLGLGFRTWRY